MRVSVIGAGYVGLVTAAEVDSVNRGVSPIREAGLDDLLAECVLASGKLRMSDDYQDVLNTDVTFICVGTPSNSDGSIGLAHIRDATKRIGSVLSSKAGYHVVVTRSTIVPGTTTSMIIPLLEQYSGKKVGSDVGVAFNPEFLQEGKALGAFFEPDRIIVGAHDERSGDVVVETFRDMAAPVVRTDVATAEMIKYASNAFLATKISFVNELANICQGFGVDVYDVVKGLSFDYRIGDKFLSAGIGFGGSCLPKDLKALVFASSTMTGYYAPLLRSVLHVNEMQCLKLVEVVERAIGDLDGRKIAVLGLAFKPGTDDIREAPAIRIIGVLLEKGASVAAYDPMAMENAGRVLADDVQLCDSAAEAIESADCVIITTEWDEFRDESVYRGKIVIDGRRALDPEKARAVCEYHGVCW